MTQGILAVFGSLALMIGLLTWLRRQGMAHWQVSRRRPRNCLELVEKLHLTPQHSLHVVRMDGHSLLIGVSPAGCSLLESRTTAQSQRSTEGVS